MVNWVGEGSAYLAGKDAHLPGCKYRLRDAESKQSLGNRWQQTGEVQERLEVKALGRLKRKRSKMEAAVEETARKTASGSNESIDTKKTVKAKLETV